MSGNAENKDANIISKSIVNYLENSRNYLLVVSGKNSSGFIENSGKGVKSPDFQPSVFLKKKRCALTNPDKKN